LYLFEAALVVLSSLAGATLIVQAIPMDTLITAIVFIVLLVAGILIQTMTRRVPDADRESTA
jgi:hypothetical protein